MSFDTLIRPVRGRWCLKATETSRSRYTSATCLPFRRNSHFASIAIREVGGDKYEIAGQLTLKGVTRDAIVPIVLKKDPAGNSVAEGNFTLKRLDFKIGEGPWADPDTVANEVIVRVRVVLPPLG